MWTLIETLLILLNYTPAGTYSLHARTIRVKEGKKEKKKTRHRTTFSLIVIRYDFVEARRMNWIYFGFFFQLT